MATLFVFVLVVIIGGVGFYVAGRPTFTPAEQILIVRGEVPAGSDLEKKLSS